MRNLIDKLWPFVLRRTYERTRQENFHLRGAIGAANEELRKHRELLARLRTGERSATAAVQAAFNSDRQADLQRVADRPS